MSVLVRGVKNSLRNPIRSASIVGVLGVVMAFVLTLLITNQAVGDRVDTLRSTGDTILTITPAGSRGFMGGGEPLTVDQYESINGIEDIESSSAIGYVFQNYSLVPNLTALENVMLPMEFAGVKIHERKDGAQELLAQVGILSDEQNRKPSHLSGGQQQRVAIARALANEPKLILADEPTGNLDSVTGKLIFDLLHKLARDKNTTIIVVTHDLDIAGKTDKVFKLQDGGFA